MDRNCTYAFDIEKNELLNDCNLRPSLSNKSGFPWLYAVNNKYGNGALDKNKEGKWLILSPRRYIDEKWSKIKEAVRNGYLWRAEVSTVHYAREEVHPLYIFTKDYSDVDDVISALDHLESSKIKPEDVDIKYSKGKPNSQKNLNKKCSKDKQGQTSRGIGKGSKEDSCIYFSDTIRQKGKFTYYFDINNKEVLTNCALCPTDNVGVWLYARNNKYPPGTLDFRKYGKWMLFLPECDINLAWKKVKAGVTSGKLWSAQVSTSPKNGSYAIFIHTKDYNDLNDVYDVSDYLERSGIKPPNVTIQYRANGRACGGTRNGSNVNWLLSSHKIYPTDSSVNQFYEYDVLERKVLIECELNPSQLVNTNFEWLYARNNKYAEESIDPEKQGKWVVFLPERSVDRAWGRIKKAVRLAELWHASVSMADRKKLKDLFMVFIYTKDCTDLKDVICVLDYIERKEIKPPDIPIKYEKDLQTASLDSESEIKPLIYSSDTIRSLSNITDYMNLIAV